MERRKEGGKRFTESGIEVKPLYAHEDIKDLDPVHDM